MPMLSTHAEVDAWLTEAGWYPGRDVGDEAVDAVAAVLERYRAYGVDIEPSVAALTFIREHAFLRAVIDTAPENFAGRSFARGSRSSRLQASPARRPSRNAPRRHVERREPP
ncbi:SUKH-3 domain-containing protein [Streptomyces cyaneofuscatus]|uniref:SUKH-3 domain-containing protein n=1 Tax=Streptomyces cyaneofuscatus TaxID=66883 RepID=UPI00365BEC91